jgi:WS/DGAT/MGAT family acyltransferase
MLRIEDETNLMMVTGVLTLDEPVDFDRLAAIICQRWLRIERFRKKVVWPVLDSAMPYFEDDPDFDLHNHLKRASLPPGGGKGALQDLVSLLSSTPLDMDRPLWQFHLVSDVDGGSAIIARTHHCLGDGSALAHAILSLADAEADHVWPEYHPPRDLTAGGSSRPAARRTFSRTRAFGQTASRLYRRASGVLRDPDRLDKATGIAKDSVAALWRFLTFVPDPDTVLKGSLGTPKRAAWSEPLSLNAIKEVRIQLGATVNDVLLSSLTGALRVYLAGRGEDVQDLTFRAVVPVNLREPGTEQELGNHMGAVFIPLPVNARHPVERLHRTNRRMTQAKESLEAPLFKILISALGSVPTPLASALVTTLTNRATAIVTNVIGPRQQLYVAGAPLRALMAWVPQTGRLGIGLSILTYVDDIYVGVISDEALVPDPERIIDAFEAEIDRLLSVVHGERLAGEPSEE